MAGNQKDRVREAQAGLLKTWKRALAAGARHFGWKIGINDPRAQRFYGLDDSVVGFMTQDSLLGDGRDFAPGTLLMAEPELAIRLSEDIEPHADDASIRRAIGEVGPSLEILNFDQPRHTLRDIMSHNIFHLGVGFGPWNVADRAMQTFVECRKNHELTASARAPQALPPLEAIVGLIARTLDDHGEGLGRGDVIISGAMTPAIPLEPGHRLEVTFSGLGVLTLTRDGGGRVAIETSGVSSF